MLYLRRIALLALAWHVVPHVANAGPLQDDLKARRARAMDGSAPTRWRSSGARRARVYSLDVDYEYRQDSNLLYLTGIDQEDTILVLMPGNETKRRSCSSAKPTRAASTGTATA